MLETKVNSSRPAAEAPAHPDAMWQTLVRMFKFSLRQLWLL
jgi:hypothetical protein